MGRYWNTNNHGGKFGFAVQRSDDPEIFGMRENEDVIHYYMDRYDIEQCRETLKAQYDLLGVPEEERTWDIGNKDDGYDLWDKYSKYAYEKDPEGHVGDLQGDTYSAKFDGAELALDRIFLGIAILSDLVNDGYCELTAEC